MRNGIAAMRSCGDVSVVITAKDCGSRQHFYLCCEDPVENTLPCVFYELKGVFAVEIRTVATDSLRISPVIARVIPL